MDEERLLYWIWLSLVFECGSNKPRRLLTESGEPQDFYRLSREERRKLGFLTEKNLVAAERVSLERARLVLDDCKRLGIAVVPYDSPSYPDRLREIYGPPMVLYVLGTLAGLDEEPCITVVGTRSETDYSNSVTGWLSKGLAQAGAVVVSGCAMGLDAAAMVGALQGGGRVVGVVACGLDVDYPKDSHALKRKVLEQGGALLSELPPGSRTYPGYFQKRNRIMAGLSLGVLVTQAPERSGALLTVEHALENGRDVYCVPPYSIFDARFYGVIKYLREGATPVFCPDDVLGPYGAQFPDKLDVAKIGGDYVPEKHGDSRREPIKAAKERQKPQPVPAASREETDRKNAKIRSTFDESQLLVYNNLDMEGRSVGELSAKTALRPGAVLSVLTELEIDGVVKALSGSRYALA